MDFWTLYWLTRLPHLFDVFDSIAAIGLMGIIVCLVMWLVFFAVSEGELNLYEKFPITQKATFLLGIIGICSLVVKSFIPTERDLAIILAGSWVTQSEEISKLPENVAQTLNQYMKRFTEGKKEESTDD